MGDVIRRASVSEELDSFEKKLRLIQIRYSARQSYDVLRKIVDTARSYVSEIRWHFNESIDIEKSLERGDPEVFTLWKKRELDGHKSELFRCLSGYGVLRSEIDKNGGDLPMIPYKTEERLISYSLQ